MLVRMFIVRMGCVLCIVVYIILKFNNEVWVDEVCVDWMELKKYLVSDLRGRERKREI